MIGNSSTAANAGIVFASSTPTTFGGTIQDTLGAGTKTTALSLSSGSLTPTGNNTYTGATTVNGGVLVAANPLSSTTFSIAGGADLTVQTGNGTAGWNSTQIGNLSEQLQLGPTTPRSWASIRPTEISLTAAISRRP